MSHSLRVAVVLIASGGFLDAHTYLVYDHVFTNAQSGNVVLIAVDLASLDGATALKHLPALLAFFPGVLTGRMIAARARIFGVRSDIAVLATEFVLFVAAALVPSAPATAATFGIAFVSAMQNTVFKSVNGTAYTSVVTTGNLRSLSEALYAGWARRDADAAPKARILGAISAAFALGALGGAAATLAFGKASILIPAALMALAALWCLRETAPMPR